MAIQVSLFTLAGERRIPRPLAIEGTGFPVCVRPKPRSFPQGEERNETAKHYQAADKHFTYAEAPEFGKDQPCLLYGEVP